MRKMLLAVVAIMLLAVPGQAKTALSTVQLSLPGVSGCSIVSGATTNINFAAVVAGTPIPVETATGSISYQCSNVPTSLALSDGANAYALTTTVAGGAPVPFTLTATLAPTVGETVVVGMYADTVTATLSFT
jgi:spore coat protein U-like protein